MVARLQLVLALANLSHILLICWRDKNGIVADVRSGVGSEVGSYVGVDKVVGVGPAVGLLFDVVEAVVPDFGLSSDVGVSTGVGMLVGVTAHPLALANLSASAPGSALSLNSKHNQSFKFQTLNFAPTPKCFCH